MVIECLCGPHLLPLLVICMFLKSWHIMQCLYLSYLHYIPIFAFIYYLLGSFHAIFINIIFCQCLSRIMFRYCSKLNTILMPNFLLMPKFFLYYYFPRKELNIYVALLPFLTQLYIIEFPFSSLKLKLFFNNAFQFSKICFHFPSLLWLNYFTIIAIILSPIMTVISKNIYV